RQEADGQEAGVQISQRPDHGRGSPKYSSGMRDLPRNLSCTAQVALQVSSDEGYAPKKASTPFRPPRQLGAIRRAGSPASAPPSAVWSGEPRPEPHRKG